MTDTQTEGGSPGPVAIDLPYRVARNVRAEVARHGETQAQIAKLIGVNQQAVSARLRGITPLTLRQVELLARHWKMSVNDLIDGNPAPIPDGGYSFHGKTLSHKRVVTKVGATRCTLRNHKVAA